MRPETFARVLRFSRQSRRRVITGNSWHRGALGWEGDDWPCWRGVCLVSVLALILADVANLILPPATRAKGFIDGEPSPPDRRPYISKSHRPHPGGRCRLSNDRSDV